MIRGFPALELPDALAPAWPRSRRSLNGATPTCAGWQVGNIHLTLKFFGNVPEDEIDALAAAARQAAAEAAPLQLQATGVGAFPSPQAPPVVWLGLGGDVSAPDPALLRVGEGLHHPGYLPEGRAFNPHLTLGRVKSPANRDRLAKMLTKMPPLYWPPFEVKELILFQSILSPQGSKYTPLQVIPLGYV